MSIPNIVTYASSWDQTGANRWGLAILARRSFPRSRRGALRWSRVARPRRRAAGRTADAIRLGACFSTVDCSSTALCWGWDRSTTSRRVKAWVASGQLVRTPGPATCRVGRVGVYTANPLVKTCSCATQKVQSRLSAGGGTLIFPSFFASWNPCRLTEQADRSHLISRPRYSSAMKPFLGTRGTPRLFVSEAFCARACAGTMKRCRTSTGR